MLLKIEKIVRIEYLKNKKSRVKMEYSYKYEVFYRILYSSF